MTTIQPNIELLQTQTAIRSRFKTASGRFDTGKLNNTQSFRESCLELSDSANVLLLQAESIAVENLKSKKFVKVHLADGTEEGTFGYKSKDANRVKSGDFVVELTGQDYFIAKTGSLGRRDDFLPNSDFDFIVFPSNEESIPYAQVLQNEIIHVLESVQLKIDHHLNGIYNFQLKLESVPEELLVTEKGVFDAEFGTVWERSCIASRALRDLKFVSGNFSGFQRLQEIINPVIYPFSSGPRNERGNTLVNQLISETKGKQSKRSTNIDLKDDGLRLIQHYNWLLRAKLGIKENSVFDSLAIAKNTKLIGADDANELSDRYAFLLQARHALSKARDIVSPFQREELDVITPDLLPQVSESMGMDSNDFSKELTRTVERTKAIIGNLLSSPELQSAS